MARPSPLGLKKKMATWIFITASIFLEVVIRMNMVFFYFAFLIGSERGFEASVFFFFPFNGGNVTIRGGDGRNFFFF